MLRQYGDLCQEALQGIGENPSIDRMDLRLGLSTEIQRGIAVIINRPFGAGDLFDKVRSKPLPDWAAEFECRSWAQFFLKWIVAQPAVSCVIPATNKPRHLEDNMHGGVGRLPDSKLRRRMVELVAAL